MIEAWPLGYLSLPFSVAAALVTAGMLQGRGWTLQQSSGRLESVDGLRGYLALAVFFGHFLVAGDYRITDIWQIPPDTFFDNLGPAGVTCFFFITAMLFYPRARASRSMVEWKRLYIGRFFRLAPLYLLAAVIVIAVALWASRSTVHATFTSNLIAVARWLALGIFGAPPINNYENTAVTVADSTWTLQYEWYFYAALPLIGWFARYVRNRMVRLAALASIFVAAATLPDFVKADISSRVASIFLLGMIAAEMRDVPAVVRLLKAPLFALIGLAAVAYGLEFTTMYDTTQVGLMFVFFLPVACGNSYFGALHATPSKILGEVSYSIYLMHGIMLYFLAMSTRPLEISNAQLWMSLPALSVALVLISAATFRFVEVPGIAIGKATAAQVAMPAARTRMIVERQ